MKTIKVTRPHWGGLAVVLVASITIGVALSLLCSVGKPMLASKIPGAPNSAIQAAVGLIDILGLGAMFIPAVGIVAAIGVRVVLNIIKKYGTAYAVRW